MSKKNKSAVLLSENGFLLNHQKELKKSPENELNLITIIVDGSEQDPQKLINELLATCKGKTVYINLHGTIRDNDHFLGINGVVFKTIDLIKNLITKGAKDIYLKSCFLGLADQKIMQLLK